MLDTLELLLMQIQMKLKQFIMYSMDEGYTSTLSIAPEGKFPVRRGNSSDPNAFTKAWSKLPVGVDRKAPLTDLYSCRCY